MSNLLLILVVLVLSPISLHTGRHPTLAAVLGLIATAWFIRDEKRINVVEEMMIGLRDRFEYLECNF